MSMLLVVGRTFRWQRLNSCCDLQGHQRVLFGLGQRSALALESQPITKWPLELFGLLSIPLQMRRLPSGVHLSTWAVSAVHPGAVLDRHTRATRSSLLNDACLK